MKALKLVIGLIAILGVITVLQAQDGDNTIFGWSMSGAIGWDTLSWTQGVYGVEAGTDLDQDGKYEIIITENHTDPNNPDSSWNWGRIHVFEVIGDDSLEEVWVSEQIHTTDYRRIFRDVTTGDLDGDGYYEIIANACKWYGPFSAADTARGIYVWEWTGNDNDYQLVSHYNFTPLGDDSLGEWWTEKMKVYDIDGDGQQELITATNGVSADDRFFILSVTGSFPGFHVWTPEYMIVRGVDFDGSPTGVNIGDLDGDGNMEVICETYNNLTVFVIEAQGPSSYQMSTPYALSSTDEYNTKSGAVGDVDGDGRDEFYICGFSTGDMYVIDMPEGVDVLNMTMDHIHFLMNTARTLQVGDSVYTFHAGDGAERFGDQDHGTGSDGPDIYLAMGHGGLYDLEFVGTDPTDSASYDEYWIYKDTLALATYGPAYLYLVPISIPPVDMDGDGKKEIVTGSMAIPDDTTAGLRVIEWNEGVAVQETWKVFPMKELKLNVTPNPAHNMVNITFSIRKMGDVTLKLYDESGRLVKNILSGRFEKGTHRVEFSTSGLSQGVYFLKLEEAGKVATTKLVILR